MEQPLAVNAENSRAKVQSVGGDSSAESLPSIGSSHDRSTLPSRVAVTRGENAWVATGKVISRTFAVVVRETEWIGNRLRNNSQKSTHIRWRNICAPSFHAPIRYLRGLIVEPVAKLHEDFARVDEMRAAKREAVVQQHAPVRDVQRLHIHRECFPEVFAQ